MDTSSLSLKQALGMTMLRMEQSGTTTQASMMIQDFSKTIEQAAPHPSVGKSIDIKV